MSASVKWQRVSPVASIYFLFDSARQAVNLWPVLVPMFAGGERVRDISLDYLLPAIIVMYLIGVVLDYWFFRYSVETDRIQIHRGVFRRKRLTLYFERVQQADIVQPFYFRPFGLAILGLESAGSKGKEVDIPVLVYERAENIKAIILAAQRRVSDESAEADNSPVVEETKSVTPDYALQLSWQEIARYGLMVNGLLILAPLLAPFMQNMEPVVESWFAHIEDSFIYSLFSSGTGENALFIAGLLIVTGIVLAAVVLFLVSVVFALVSYWDYRLERVGDQFTCRSGFGTVKTRGFKLHKMQQVIITQGLVARLLKRYTVTIRKAGEGVSSGDVPSRKRFIIPVLDAVRLADIENEFSIPAASWQRVSRLYIVRGVLFYGTVLCVIAGCVLFATDNMLIPALLAYPLMALLVYRFWWCLGIFQNDQWLALRSGFISQKIQWMPIGKAQATKLTQPPWLKPWKLANLSVWSADGRLHVPFIPVTTAALLRDTILFRVVTFKGRWL